MARPSRLNAAKNDILSRFSEASKKVYSEADIARVLLENRHTWNLAQSTKVSDFISFLKTQGDLKKHEFRSEYYDRNIIRYSWGNASVYELALSIKQRGYLCHATAVTLHGLVKHSRKTIYLNVEQSPKPSSNGGLTQDAINRAFSGKQRQSNLIYAYNGSSIIMVAGKNTNHLGVEEIVGPASETISVTNLERTLIDIVVRPAYAGGVSQLLKAYRAAKARISADRLVAILKNLDYVYPYHQPIGFLMQEAGYPKQAVDQLSALGLDHDFYLAHGLQQPEYSQDWRLFYPKNFRGH
jgi:predicted transcriptional regulator of viral defense system